MALSLTLPSFAAGQSDEEPDRRWNVSAELSYTDQTGNRVLRLLTGGLKLSHLEKEQFELDGGLQTRYGKSDDEVVARNHYAFLSFDLQPGAEWSPFLFADAERDEFKRLDARFAGGAGAKYTPFRDARGTGVASLSLALLYSFEKLAPTEEELHPPSRSTARWSLRVKGAQDLRPGVHVHHTSFYQPVWDQMADYLLRSDTGAKVLLTERLAFSVGYQLNRTNRPPAGVAPEDRLFKTGFIIDF